MLPRRGEGEAGFALVLVMWVLLLLGLLGTGLLHEARMTRQQAASVSGALQARAAADGAIRRVILGLLDPRDPLRWPLDGTRHTMTLFGRPIQVQVASEAGKIDLNAASPDLLATLFRGAGLGPSEAAGLAASIVAWRQPTHASTDDPNAPYHDAGRPYGPRQGPFRAVSELRLVLGMTDALQEAVSPLVTVWSHAPGVDRGAAGDNMLDLLAQAGDGLAGLQRTAREHGEAAGADRPPGVGEALAITAQLEEGGRVTERRAIIQLAGSRKEPYRVLSWR